MEKEKKPKFNITKYKNEYKKKNYDSISLILPKGEKEKLQNDANDYNLSLNKYILKKIKGDDNNGK